MAFNFDIKAMEPAGARRSYVTTLDGSILERSTVYLEPEQWDILDMICRMTQTSCSRVIARLVEDAGRNLTRTAY